MARDVVKIFCPRRGKNHRVGTMVADAEGYAVRYVAEVWHPGVIFGSEQEVTDRLDGDAVTELAAFCRVCNKSVTLNSRALLRAAQRGTPGTPGHHAPFADSLDKQWADAGRRPMYPGDLRRLRHDPRDPGQ
jgi:hypothetical protein